MRRRHDNELFSKINSNLAMITQNLESIEREALIPVAPPSNRLYRSSSHPSVPLSFQPDTTIKAPTYVQHSSASMPQHYTIVQQQPAPWVPMNQESPTMSMHRQGFPGGVNVQRKIDQVLAKLEHNKEETQKSLDEIDAKIQRRMDIQLEPLRDELTNINQSVDEIRLKCKQIDKRSQDMQGELIQKGVSADSQKANFHHSLEITKQDLDSLKDKIADENKVYSGRLASLQSKISTSETTPGELKMRIGVLENDVRMMRENQGNNQLENLRQLREISECQTEVLDPELISTLQNYFEDARGMKLTLKRLQNTIQPMADEFFNVHRDYQSLQGTELRSPNRNISTQPRKDSILSIDLRD